MKLKIASAKRVYNFKNPVSRQKMLIFLFCLIISFGAWLFIKLSKENAITIPLAVGFIKVPGDYQIKSLSDSTVLLTVKTEAFRLFFNTRFKTPVSAQFDFERIQKLNRQGSMQYYITTNALGNRLSASMDIPRNLIQLSPDTVFLDLVRNDSRTVPVVFKGNISFSPQHQLYSHVQLSQDSVIIRGPSSLLRKIDVLFTDSVSLENLSDDREIQLDVVVPDKMKSLVFVDPPIVTASIDVEKFTESIIEIPILPVFSDQDLENRPDLRFFPEKVKITCRVALKDFKKVNAEWFQAVAMYPPDKDEKSNYLKVNVVAFPEFINIVSYEPEAVEYVIVKP